jgi:hypothetical protein
MNLKGDGKLPAARLPASGRFLASPLRELLPVFRRSAYLTPTIPFTDAMSLAES